MTKRLRVASVPAGHPYVTRTLDDTDLVVLPDPATPSGVPGQWWPPTILTDGWIAAHADEADLLHLHFGTESFEPAQLVDAVNAAHDAGWPVVQTVHDLVHPQLVDQEPYRRQLDALVPLVDALVTLTPGAAAEIERTWGRTALVIPHPRLLPAGHVAPPGSPRRDIVIGLHLKDLRPNVDGPGAVADLVTAIRQLRAAGVPAIAEVRLHRTVRDEVARERVRRLIAAADSMTLVEHDRLDDTELEVSLAALDVCVLPYRSGTHSGWLELCWDLGVPVAVPDVGYFAEQHDDPTVDVFVPGGATPAQSSLTACLLRLLWAGPAAGTGARSRLSAGRLAQRDIDDRAATRTHLDLYRQLLSPAVAR